MIKVKHMNKLRDLKHLYIRGCTDIPITLCTSTAIP